MQRTEVCLVGPLLKVYFGVTPSKRTIWADSR